MQSGAGSAKELVILKGWASLTKMAAKLGRHPDTLRRWAKSGLIDAKKMRGQYYVRPEQFEKVTL